MTHVLTGLYWEGGGAMAGAFLREGSRVCWSFLPGCEGWAPSFAMTQALAVLMILCGAAATVLFVFRRTSGIAALVLGAAVVAKLAVFLQDYRFMGNYHYMPFWMLAVFAFASRRLEVGVVMLGLFYFFAGLLKFNVEWLSGAAMIRPPVISGKLLEWATALVVVLECVLVFGLWSSRRRLRRAVWLAFAAFHLFSWHIVGFFYPLVMFAMLAFVWFLPSGTVVNWRTWGVRDWALPALFVIAQLIPAFLFPRSAVTGEGRLLALNMFDAKTVCQSSLVWEKGSERVEFPSRVEGLGVRLHCDPQVHWALARSAYCPHLEGGRLGLVLATRLTTDARVDVFRADDLCGGQRPFDLLGGWQ